MKIYVKTLKGSRFEIEVKPDDKIADTKKAIESSQGADIYPTTQQMLIYQGQVLKDETTLEENKVNDNSSIVVMLTKNRGSSSSTAKAPQTSAPTPAPTPVSSPTGDVSDAYRQSTSNLVTAGSDLEVTIEKIVDVGAGTWDRDTVVRALGAAFNNPERAVEYLYSGIPKNASNVQHVTSSNANANPLDFLRNHPQFEALRAMVQANPQILQPMLQELGKQNPQLLRMIQEHQEDFHHLINEPIEGNEQFAEVMPQSVTVTPEEREAIERLEAMGFDHAVVLQVFFACNKNEELAANYLLDHMDD